MAARPPPSADQSARPGSLASTVNALSLLVASQQSKTALAKFKRRGLIERRLLAADELKAHEVRHADGVRARERTTALMGALASLSARVRLSAAEWHAQPGPRPPFSACAGRMPTATSDAILQASWLVVPPLDALCDRALTERRVAITSTASTRTAPSSILVSDSNVPAATDEAAPAPEPDTGTAITGDRGDIHVANASRMPVVGAHRAEARPFETADSPLADLRAFAFHPLFASAAAADVCGAPLAGALVDSAAVLKRAAAGQQPAAVTAPILSPAVVLCVAEFVSEVLQVRVAAASPTERFVYSFSPLSAIGAPQRPACYPSIPRANAGVLLNGDSCDERYVKAGASSRLCAL